MLSRVYKYNLNLVNIFNLLKQSFFSLSIDSHNVHSLNNVFEILSNHFSILVIEI